MHFSLPEGHAPKEGLKVLTWVAKYPSARHSLVGGGGVAQIQLALVPNSGHILLHQVAFGENVSPKLMNFSLD